MPLPVDAAERAYDLIRRSRVDVAAIARCTGFKPSNIEKVKRHLFMDAHLLDRYVAFDIPAVVARFDSDAGIAAAWHRLQTPLFTPADIQLLKHEIAEAWYMRNVAPGWNEAHNAAQRRFRAPEL